MPHPAPMRVLYLTDSLSDLDGVGRYAVRLIHALEELEPGLQVEVLLARKHRPTSADVPPRWKVTVALPPDYFFHMAPARFWASLAAAAWRTRRAARRADLVHAIKDYPHNLAALLGARAAGRPCIATAHGTYTVQPLLAPRHARLARWTYERFAALIAVSGHTAERVRAVWDAEGRAPLRMPMIPNAVDAGRYERHPALERRPWQDVRYTLSIGELKERKGHHLALEAWCALAPRHPDLHHFVIGKGSRDAYHRGLLERVAASGLGTRVHFLGNTSEEEKIDLLQRAEVFVHTPVTAADGGFEGFGIVYLEAAAAGTPSVGTRGSGAEDAIVDGRTGLLVEPEAAAIERGLERLLNDAALRTRLSEEGRRHARASSWRANAEQVLALYRSALAERAR